MNYNRVCVALLFVALHPFFGEGIKYHPNVSAAQMESSSLPRFQLNHREQTNNKSDREIKSGDEMGMTAVYANDFADARQLQMERTEAHPHSFLNWRMLEVHTGTLDLAEAQLSFHAVENAPENQFAPPHFLDHSMGMHAPISSELHVSRVDLDSLISTLRVFYNSTNGQDWSYRDCPDNSHWDFTQRPQSIEELARWCGLIFSEGVLTEIFLRDQNLTGSIPPELGNLANLKTLNLAKNQLGGSIPPELGNLVNLEILILDQNQLTGEIPSELGNLEQLRDLFLSFNPLTGTVPSQLANLKQLERLYIFYNQLTGSIPPGLTKLEQLKDIRLGGLDLPEAIFAEFAKLERLEKLSLYNCQLTGGIPPELLERTSLIELVLTNVGLAGSIPSGLDNLVNLEILDLSRNQLTGTIPPELGNLVNLEHLHLFRNRLTGSIPSEFGRLSSVDIIDLSGNKLSGPIPSELGNLVNLGERTLQPFIIPEIDLSFNQLTGEIPPELGNLPNLEHLNLSWNQLTGEIPPELGRLTNLQKLGLVANPLTGSIPPELGNLVNLRDLRIQRTQLTGPIPSEFGNLVNLESLRLRRNQLTGSIPPELGRLRKLAWIMLSDNALTGTIPPELGNLNLGAGEVLIDTLIVPLIGLANNQLTGAIPAELGNLVPLQSLDLSGNNLTHTIPSTFGDLINLGSLRLSNNRLTGALPKSLTQIKTLRTLEFDENSGLCSPPDQAFQTWLSTVDNMTGDMCSVVSFSYKVDHQSYPRLRPIAPLVLPISMTGTPPIQYIFNVLDLPSGLQYTPSTHTISGTPTQVTPPVPFTYTAMDALQTRDSLQFTIEVYSPVATEQETLPEKFDVRTNYPNPFRYSTHLVMDLPWAAQIGVEVMDVTGRRVMRLPAVNVDAGREQTIEVDGTQLSSGLYAYRLIVTSPTNTSMHVGHFTRIQ